jgi:nucleotide-binding universal stress UspA family protein
MDPIVVGTDGSPGAEAAIRKVIDLAGGSGATVHLVAAYPGRTTLERLGMTAKSDAVDMRGVAMDVLARDERRFAEAGFSVEKHAREGDPAHVIADVADEQDAGMVVVGASGTAGGGTRFTLGNVASKLAHHVSRSLLIVRED